MRSSSLTPPANGAARASLAETMGAADGVGQPVPPQHLLGGLGFQGFRVLRTWGFRVSDICEVVF